MKSTIKSIVVKRKPMDLSIGRIVYTCDAFSSCTYVIVGEPETDPWKLKVHCINSDHDFYIGRDTEIFLGDLGVQGYAYDNRPCSLFTSKEAAVAHAGKYYEWLSTSRYNEPYDDYRWCY